MQRLPRYELLFNDLCKLTPVCDDPQSHAAIAALLDDFSKVCQRMNQAKDTPAYSHLHEATWLIGERLNFSTEQLPRSIFMGLLGPLMLCGCLHVAYRARDRIRGCYVICVLFNSTLLLASAVHEQPNYRVLLGVSLANMAMEESDNGKGLQCHTAPHSWKLVFEHGARMFEILLTACSAIEATVWRQRITTCIETQSRAVAEGHTHSIPLQSPLVGEMRSIGKAFGKPGSFVRQVSVHRTATVGPTSDLTQVVIKNTQAVKEALDGHSTTSLPRSQSVATPSHV